MIMRNERVKETIFHIAVLALLAAIFSAVLTGLLTVGYICIAHFYGFDLWLLLSALPIVALTAWIGGMLFWHFK